MASPDSTNSTCARVCSGCCAAPPIREERAMSNSDFLLAIEDLTVSFDGFKAIDSLNLYLERGELRVVIGPNGAGKTTLLDLICGKTRETTGSIVFKGSELTEMKEHDIVRSGVGRK